MKHTEKSPTGLLHSAENLKQLVLDNPDLPLLVFAGGDANIGDYGYESCSYVLAEVGEFLDCCQDINDERCYYDRDDFREDLEYKFGDDFDDYDEEFERFINDKLNEYEPYWKKCIIIRVDN